MAPAVTPDIEIHDTSRYIPAWHSKIYALTGNDYKQPNISYYFAELPEKVVSCSGFGSLDAYLDEVKIHQKAIKFGFEVPSKESFFLANAAVDIIKKLNGQIDHLNPTEDGGILIEFYQKGIFHMLDIYNDGEIIYVKDAQTKIVENISHNLSKELNSRLG